VIDVQIGIIADPEMSQGPQVLRNIQDLIAKARAQHKPVIYMQHDALDSEDLLSPGHTEWLLHPDIAPAPLDPVLHKHSSDSFLRTDLDAVLKQMGIEHIAVVGCATDYCVDTTCRSALSHGYAVTLASDAHTTGDDGVLSGDAIIDHHNRILANIAIEKACIQVKSSAEIWSETGTD
jgi:nicotinamidase-related amidase